MPPGEHRGPTGSQRAHAPRVQLSDNIAAWSKGRIVVLRYRY
jgi:hypothetical protein